MRVSGRWFSLSILALAFIFGFYVIVQSTSVRGQVIEVGRTCLMDKGHLVGRVLSVKREIVSPNFRYDPIMKFERPDLIDDRLCWIVRFERLLALGKPASYIEVWIDAAELLVVGGEQCK
jgi:hypothetical protein